MRWYKRLVSNDFEERARGIHVERLWTPWRMEYIRSLDKGECIFCRKLKSDDDRGEYVLERGEHTFLMLNKYPYNTGHLMVAPYRHVDLPSELTKEEIEELFHYLVRGEKMLRGAFNPDGMNVGANVGRCSGAGVVGHFHLHVVPRWAGDTNFFPILGETKVLPQSLEETYDTLLSVNLEE
jgi:ATP adenylyltransferase